MINARHVAGAHAAYYIATGVWSIVHRRSFERITGPKRDYWLVRTVGALAVAIGTVLGHAVATDRRQRESVLLALASAFAFAYADVQGARASSRIYLGDALLHVVLVPAWLRRWRAEPQPVEPDGAPRPVPAPCETLGRTPVASVATWRSRSTDG